MLNIHKLFDVQMMIAATETEDEVGCVLRVHLMAENILINYIDSVKNPETEKYLGKMRDFGVKMAVATALGMPRSVLQVLSHINHIRNDFAHRGVSKLHPGDVQNLQRFVDEVGNLKPGYSSVKDRTIEYLDGKMYSYGEGDLRSDFIISAMTFLSEAILIIVLAAVPSMLKKGELVVVDPE